jgi:hypothetical protein
MGSKIPNDLKEMYSRSYDLFDSLIAATERMHAASLKSQAELLKTVKDGAEKVDPENYSILMETLLKDSTARIEADRAIGLELAANGRFAIKALAEVATKAIEFMAPVIQAQAEASTARANAQWRKPVEETFEDEDEDYDGSNGFGKTAASA